MNQSLGDYLLFCDWFTFPGNLHRYKICLSVNDHLNILTFQTPKYGCFSIRASTIYSWNSLENLLTSKKIKYILTEYFIEKN